MCIYSMCSSRLKKIFTSPDNVIAERHFLNFISNRYGATWCKTSIIDDNSHFTTSGQFWNQRKRFCNKSFAFFTRITTCVYYIRDTIIYKNKYKILPLKLRSNIIISRNFQKFMILFRVNYVRKLSVLVRIYKLIKGKRKSKVLSSRKNRCIYFRRLIIVIQEIIVILSSSLSSSFIWKCVLIRHSAHLNYSLCVLERFRLTIHGRTTWSCTTHARHVCFNLTSLTLCRFRHDSRSSRS